LAAALEQRQPDGNMTVVDSSSGRFGEFGGRFVPEAWLRRSTARAET